MSHTPEELEYLLKMIEAAAPVPSDCGRLALTREECLMLREAIDSLRQKAGELSQAGGCCLETYRAAGGTTDGRDCPYHSSGNREGGT